MAEKRIIQLNKIFPVFVAGNKDDERKKMQHKKQRKTPRVEIHVKTNMGSIERTEIKTEERQLRQWIVLH